jgi:hypothetical protein
MSSHAFSFLFIVFLLVSLVVRFWLSSRQIKHILAHRATVPAQFTAQVTLPAHQKAADYTIAKTKYGLVALACVHFASDDRPGHGLPNQPARSIRADFRGDRPAV